MTERLLQSAGSAAVRKRMSLVNKNTLKKKKFLNMNPGQYFWSGARCDNILDLVEILTRKERGKRCEAENGVFADNK